MLSKSLSDLQDYTLSTHLLDRLRKYATTTASASRLLQV